MTQYPTKPLPQLCEVLSGGTPKTTKTEYWNGDVAWASVKDFNTGNRWFSSTEKQITAEGLANCSSVLLQPGDLILSARGTVGVVAQCAIETAFNQSNYGLRAKPLVSNSAYLYYAVSNARSTLLNDSHGGMFDTITRESLARLEIPAPNLDIQWHIADVLGSLDRKIQTNKELSKTLEDIAQTIFKSWFIDFDPVKAKMAGEQPVGMDAETAALFPDSMEESELGLIPRGWAESFLSEISAISKISINPQKYLDTDFIHYSIPAFDSGSSPIKVSGSHVLSNKFVLDSNAVLVSKLNPQTTRIWTVLDPVVSSVCSTEFIVLVPKEECYLSFLNATVRDPYFLDTLVSMATGSTGSRQRIRPEEVFQIGIALPSLELIVRFHAIAMPIIKKLQVIREENQALSKLRDSLLPRLISGELQIPDEMLAS